MGSGLYDVRLFNFQTEPRRSSAAEGSAIWIGDPVSARTDLFPSRESHLCRCSPSNFSNAVPLKPVALPDLLMRTSTKNGGWNPRLISTASTASTRLGV